MTKKITLYGGFHNSPEIKIMLNENVIEDLKSGKTLITDDGVLSPNQRKKLENHFCGIRGCQCGSFVRATILFD